MKMLWAPWRMKYITSPPEDTCFLCAAWRSREEKRHLVLHKGSVAFVLMNRYPYNNGHLMVACSRHLGDLDAVGAQVRAEILELVNLSVKVLKDAVSPHGFNVGVNLGKIAGAGMDDHLHVHVVPRWNGDTNYMPVLAETKVMPEHLDATFEKLRPFFKDNR